MKYRCTSSTAVLASIGGRLRQVAPGEIVEADRKPQGDFAIVQEAEPKPKPVKKAVKKTTKKVIQNADSTETSSVW